MPRFIGGFEVDKNGNAQPGSVRLTDDQVAARMAQGQGRMAQVMAAAGTRDRVIERVEASLAAGTPVTLADLDTVLAGSDFSERLRIKTGLRRKGLIADELGAEVEKVEANADMMTKVSPHAARLDAAADAMEKAGIGLHNPDGHVHQLRRMASSMRADAAEGRLPHRYIGGPWH